jgi:hypothetical protein
MTGILECLRDLRAGRRQTIRTLGRLDDACLTEPVGARPGNVRSALLALAQDDDRRCVAVAATLAALQWQPTEAQRILSRLTLTRGELRAAFVGLSDDLLDRSPAAGEWAVREVARHLMNNERRFVLDADEAVQQLRGAKPSERPGEPQGPGSLGPPAPGGVEALLAMLEEVRDAVVAVSAPLTASELTAPLVWAGRSVDVRFMLYRRATHERQHTVQLHKALHAIGFQPSEVHWILAQAEVARATLEGMVLGLPDELVERSPQGVPPSVARLLADAPTEEAVAVEAILAAGASHEPTNQPASRQQL